MDDKTTRKLFSSPDAMIWAQEWCRIARDIEASDDGREVIDEGWMIGWFANAMCVAVDHDRIIRQQKGAVRCRHI